MKYLSLRNPSQRDSIVNGDPVYDVFLCDLNARKWKTYVQPRNHNYAYWQDVISTVNTHSGPAIACILEGDWRIKDEEQKLINADSRFNVVWVGFESDLTDEFKKYSEDTSDIFGDIFE